jgi:2,4-dienoyl-CoA reductase-like NADH-dependent reductase (Old Yellow Enzyme family)
MTTTNLFTPLKIGAWKLPNRIVYAPLTRCRAEPGRVPGKMMAEYYRQRASAGLIIAEATAVTPMGVGYPDTPGIWSDEQVEGWKLVTNSVHEGGGRIVLQLWHVGRVSDPYYLDGQLPVAPSAIALSGHVNLLRPKREFVVPRALELNELPAIIEDYRKGAENAKKAGFDGVEIHGANGYLLNQFLNPSSNIRTDEYGGSVENRARLMLEALDAAISVWGPEYVGLHISPGDGEHNMQNGDNTDDYVYVMREASKRNIAFVCARETQHKDQWLGDILRKEFSGVYIANEEFTYDSSLQTLANGQADAIAFGRPYISNPDLPERFLKQISLNEADPEKYYSPGPEGYIDYPVLSAA